MTDQQKKDIRRFRKAGMTYAQISERVGVSTASIKTMFFRQKQRAEDEAVIRCRYCGKIVTQPGTEREKHFCDRHCYKRWWDRQADHPRTEYVKECAFCGKTFKSVSKKQQKYCSHNCYHAARKARPES